MKKFLFSLPLVLFAGEAFGQDPRMDRMITLLERMDERMSRFESRLSSLEGGCRSPSPSPAVYRMPAEQAAFQRGYGDALKQVSSAPLRYSNSSGRGIPIQYASDDFTDDPPPIRVNGGGGGRCMVIRICFE